MIRRRRRSTHDSRIKGDSYPQAWCEDAVGALLAEIGRVDDGVITEVVRLHGGYRPCADELTLARIERAREEASRQLAKTCDVVAWQATMAPPGCGGAGGPRADGSPSSYPASTCALPRARSPAGGSPVGATARKPRSKWPAAGEIPASKRHVHASQVVLSPDLV